MGFLGKVLICQNRRPQRWFRPHCSDSRTSIPQWPSPEWGVDSTILLQWQVRRPLTTLQQVQPREGQFWLLHPEQWFSDQFSLFGVKIIFIHVYTKSRVPRLSISASAAGEYEDSPVIRWIYVGLWWILALITLSPCSFGLIWGSAPLLPAHVWWLVFQTEASSLFGGRTFEAVWALGRETTSTSRGGWDRVSLLTVESNFYFHVNFCFSGPSLRWRFLVKWWTSPAGLTTWWRWWSLFCEVGCLRTDPCWAGGSQDERSKPSAPGPTAERLTGDECWRSSVQFQLNWTVFNDSWDIFLQIRPLKMKYSVLIPGKLSSVMLYFSAIVQAAIFPVVSWRKKTDPEDERDVLVLPRTTCRGRWFPF